MKLVDPTTGNFVEHADLVKMFVDGWVEPYRYDRMLVKDETGHDRYRETAEFLMAARVLMNLMASIQCTEEAARVTFDALLEYRPINIHLDEVQSYFCFRARSRSGDPR